MAYIFFIVTDTHYDLRIVELTSVGDMIFNTAKSLSSFGKRIKLNCTQP
jgi:hypothetical protein